MRENDEGATSSSSTQPVSAPVGDDEDIDEVCGQINSRQIVRLILRLFRKKLFDEQLNCPWRLKKKL